LMERGSLPARPPPVRWEIGASPPPQKKNQRHGGPGQCFFFFRLPVFPSTPPDTARAGFATEQRHGRDCRAFFQALSFPPRQCLSAEGVGKKFSAPFGPPLFAGKGPDVSWSAAWQSSAPAVNYRRNPRPRLAPGPRAGVRPHDEPAPLNVEEPVLNTGPFRLVLAPRVGRGLPPPFSAELIGAAPWLRLPGA